MRKAVIRLLVAFLITPSLCFSADWPQFRGPNRDGKSAETGLLKKWAKEGPPLLWSCEGLGQGYASVSVVKRTVYTTGILDNEGYLFAIDKKGKLLWKKEYGTEWTGGHPGTRTTPTVDGERLYLMSGHGRLVCFNRETSDLMWKVDTLEKYEGKNLRWGIGESVIIVDDRVICTPGGQDATVVALDKMTGKTLWTTKVLSELSAYCSPVMIERDGKSLLITMVEKSIVCIDPNNGEVLWQIPHKPKYSISAVSPVYTDGLFYVSNGYGGGGRMFEISPDGSSYTEKWTDKALDCHHGGVVLVDGHIYGGSSKGKWVCLELTSGNVKYESEGVGKGSVIYADGLLYCYGEKGEVGLAKATPDGYQLTGSFTVLQGTDKHWAHPVISDGCLYIRHGDVLMAYDIKGKKEMKIQNGFSSFTMNDINEKPIALSQYQGKVILVVNVASKCGYTKQYSGLQELYEKYKEQGLVILGFPANNFGSQEPGTNSEIKNFCTTKFNVTFPVFSKISVKGKDIHPLYQYLTNPEANGEFGKPIAWNFNKFLIGKNGNTVARFKSKVAPLDSQLIDTVESELKK